MENDESSVLHTYIIIIYIMFSINFEPCISDGSYTSLIVFSCKDKTQLYIDSFTTQNVIMYNVK